MFVHLVDGVSLLAIHSRASVWLRLGCLGWLPFGQRKDLRFFLDFRLNWCRHCSVRVHLLKPHQALWAFLEQLLKISCCVLERLGFDLAQWTACPFCLVSFLVQTSSQLIWGNILCCWFSPLAHYMWHLVELLRHGDLDLATVLNDLHQVELLVPLPTPLLMLRVVVANQIASQTGFCWVARRLGSCSECSVCVMSGRHYFPADVVRTTLTRIDSHLLLLLFFLTSSAWTARFAHFHRVHIVTSWESTIYVSSLLPNRLFLFVSLIKLFFQLAAMQRLPSLLIVLRWREVLVRLIVSAIRRRSLFVRMLEWEVSAVSTFSLVWCSSSILLRLGR